MIVHILTTIIVAQTCPESTRRNIQDAFQSALNTDATHTTSQLKRLEDTSTHPGMYRSIKASVLVNGEGSKTAQLTANDAIAKKLSKSVMIDLKNSFSTDAVEQIDEITVALHTKKGHDNGASDMTTLRPVSDEQITSSHTYVDVPPEVWDKALFDTSKFGQLLAVSVVSGGSGYAQGEVLTMSSPLDGSGGLPATLTVTSVDAKGMVTGIAITNPGKRFGAKRGPAKVVGKTSLAASLAITGSATGTGLSLKIDSAEEQHHTAFLRISHAGETTNRCGCETTCPCRVLTGHRR